MRANRPVLPPSLASMGALVSPYGLVSRLSWLPVTEGDPDFFVYSASLGDPGAALSVQQGWIHRGDSGNFDGAGSALDRETAAHIAVAESLERYSSSAWAPEDLIWATVAELGEDAVGPLRWPQCSEAELADTRCGLVPADARLPLRWVRGWSLTRSRPVFVPAVQVYLRCLPESPAERYTHPVSTGCAAHMDPVAAVVNGILEVVERDSVALTWLQRLPLPRLTVGPQDLSEEEALYCRRADNPNVTTMLFDATTDLGIPVIYGLQIAEHDPNLAQVVAATSAVDPGSAVAKLHRELASLRIALRAWSAEASPASDGPVSVMAGALAAGPPGQRPLFDFLLTSGGQSRDLDAMPRPVAGEAALPWLLDRLHRAGCEVIVVDLTTDEARQIGATVVRVLIPELMPLSFAHRARYLGHPRLYSAPAAMGHRVLSEQDINSDLQPFA